VAAIVTRTHILIEVTILFAGCVILARKSAIVRVLGVVTRPETLWVGGINETVAVIV
jgi:hypothetical protein